MTIERAQRLRAECQEDLDLALATDQYEWAKSLAERRRALDRSIERILRFGPTPDWQESAA